MTLDVSKLRDAFHSIHTTLTPAQATAIVDIARLAASTDGRMDLNEMGTIAQLSEIVMTMAGAPDAAVPGQPVAADRLQELGQQLQNRGARELAYAAAILVVHADRKLTDGERDFATKLAAATFVEPPRAQELEQMMVALLKR